MENYNQGYVDKFIEIAEKRLELLGFSIIIKEVNGSGGARLTRIQLSHLNGSNFYVEYQDNRYDYTSGVLVYACKDGQYDSNKILLPKKGDFYNYFGPHRDIDIKKLIADFCKLPVVKNLV